MTRRIAVGHDSITAHESLAAVQLAAMLAREKIRATNTNADTTKVPTPFIAPAGKAVTKPPTKAVTKPAATGSAAKSSTPTPAKPVVEPGGLILSAADVAVLVRLIDSHPLTKETT